MREENLSGSDGRSTPTFLPAVAAFKPAADLSDDVLQDKEVFNSRPRPRNAYPAPPGTSGVRRSHAHRLLAAGGHGPSSCSTGAGMLLRCFEEADI